MAAGRTALRSLRSVSTDSVAVVSRAAEPQDDKAKPTNEPDDTVRRPGQQDEVANRADTNEPEE